MSSRPRKLFGPLVSLLDSVRGSYWFVPVLMALGAAALAFWLVEYDRELEASVIGDLPWISASDAEGTRAMLSVIAGSMITVTGVVFSITIVALTLASSQFGPRLLRTFLRDRANQFAFGTFVATFLYSLLVLRAVRGDDVPDVASFVALVLASASLFVLIYFIHHTATSIQASRVISAVAAELDEQLERLFPEQLGLPPEDAEGADAERAARAAAGLRERLDADGVPLRARADAVLRVIDQGAVFDLAVEHDLVIELLQRPGDFTCAETPLARVGPAGRAGRDVLDALHRRLVTGTQRTAVQDLRFLTGQLTEIAVRALSPGVNDPRTACECVSRLGAVLGIVARRAMPAAERHDEQGELRVLAPATTFEGVVADCLDPIRRYGAKHVSVVLAVCTALEQVAGLCTSAPRRAVLAAHLRALHADFGARAETHERDREAVDAAMQRALARLG